ncbi:MAG: hypothetical protein K5640_06985 [Treponema sp.]|nr:hypothetical protein [Treponema sp.]
MIIKVGNVCVKHDLINSIYTTSERSMGYDHTYTIIQCSDGRNLKVSGNCVDDLIKALNQKEAIYNCGEK